MVGVLVIAVLQIAGSEQAPSPNPQVYLAEEECASCSRLLALERARNRVLVEENLSLRSRCMHPVTAGPNDPLLLPLPRSLEGDVAGSALEDRAQLASSTSPHRSLLQTSSTRHCSKAEVNQVFGAEDRAATVMTIMSSNFPCAMCIITCAPLPGFDGVLCVNGCLHQHENACSVEETARLEPMTSNASLDNRKSIVSLLEQAGADCVYAILETVEFVFGVGSVKSYLQILVDYPVQPRETVAPLAVALRLAHVQAAIAAMQSELPIGLTTAASCIPESDTDLNKEPSIASSTCSAGEASLAATDLYVPVPSVERFNGYAVYKGLNHAQWLYSCPSVATVAMWAITPVYDRAQWSHCVGIIRIDLATLQAQFQYGLGAETPMSSVHFDADLAQCSQVLSTEARRLAAMQPPMPGAESRDREGGSEESEVLEFLGSASALEISCTLLWKLGPHSATIRKRSTIVRIPARTDSIELIGDITVRAGESLRIEGEGDPLRPIMTIDSRQLRVEKGGSLELVRLCIEGSTGGSAIFSEGSVVISNCTVRRCVVTSNVVGRFAEGSARPKDGLSAESAPRPAFFGSAGGVVLMAYSGASLSVMDSSFEENSAKEGMQINWAGCVCALGGLIALGSSEMVGNTAAGGLLIAGGGAIVGLFASIEINESSLVANMACGGEITPYA